MPREGCFGAILFVLVAACTSSDDSQGPRGELLLQIHGTDSSDLRSTDTPVFAGGGFGFVASGAFSGALTVHSLDESIVRVIGSDTVCQTGTCLVVSACEAKRAGDVRFEITDARGAVVGHTDIHVREAVSVGLSVAIAPPSGDADGPAVAPGPDGIYQVATGSRFQILPHPVDASGAALLCADRCASIELAGDGLIKPEIGRLVFTARAAAKGTTTVILHSGALKTTGTIRITD